MMKVEIKEAGKEDCQRIMDLAWKIWPEWYEDIIGPEQLSYMLDHIYNPESLAQQMENGQDFYILQADNADIGFMALRAGGSMRIEKLYLLPAFRGTGLGSRLLAFAEKKAAEKNCLRLQLNVNRFNPSLAFYKRHGFKAVENIDISFGPFFLNDFVMEKDLPSGR